MSVKCTAPGHSLSSTDIQGDLGSPAVRLPNTYRAPHTCVANLFEVPPPRCIYFYNNSFILFGCDAVIVILCELDTRTLVELWSIAVASCPAVHIFKWIICTRLTNLCTGKWYSLSAVFGLVRVVLDGTQGRGEEGPGF